MKETIPQTEDSQQIPKRTNKIKFTPKHIHR